MSLQQFSWTEINFEVLCNRNVEIYSVIFYFYRSLYLLVLWEHVGFQHINAQMSVLLHGCVVVCCIISLSKTNCLYQLLLADAGGGQGEV